MVVKIWLNDPQLNCTLIAALYESWMCFNWRKLWFKWKLGWFFWIVGRWWQLNKSNGYLVSFLTRTCTLIFFIIMIDFSCCVQVLCTNLNRLHTSLLTNIVYCCPTFWYHLGLLDFGWWSDFCIFACNLCCNG